MGRSPGLEFKPFVALGIVSYAFYLWHLPVFFAIRYFDPHWNDVVRVVVAIVVTLALTIMSWFLLERPLTRWGSRLEARRKVKLATLQSPTEVTPLPSDTASAAPANDTTVP